MVKNNIKALKGVIFIILNKKVIFLIVLALILSSLIYFIFFKETKTYNGVFVKNFSKYVGDFNGNLY